MFGRRPAHASCSASVRCSSLHLLHCFTLRLRRSGPRCPLVRLRGGSAPSATADGAPPIVVPPIATEPKPIPGESMMPAESRGIVGGGRIGANGHGPWMRGIGSAARGGGGIGSAARGGGIGSAARGGAARATWRGAPGGGFDRSVRRQSADRQGPHSDPHTHHRRARVLHERHTSGAFDRRSPKQTSTSRSRPTTPLSTTSRRHECATHESKGEQDDRRTSRRCQKSHHDRRARACSREGRQQRANTCVWSGGGHDVIHPV